MLRLSLGTSKKEEHIYRVKTKEMLREMEKALKQKKKYVVECDNKIGQKLTIGDNLTFDYFPDSMKYIQLQHMTSPDIFYADLSD